MPSSKTLNASNLELLGAAQLAALLIEISTGNAPAQRRLRLALAGNAGAADAARAVLKRLASISRAKTWLDWQKIKPLVAEFEGQRRTILELVAPSDPREAFELIWRLVACAESVLSRSDDSGDRLAAAFHAAARDLGPLAPRAGIGVEELAGRAFRVMADDGVGAWRELVSILARQLGPAGLARMRELSEAWRTELARSPGKDERAYRYDQAIRSILQGVADALGDVDGYIEQFGERARRMPEVAAAIARRMLDAGRAGDALTVLDAVDADRYEYLPVELDEARVEALEALGRADAAQAFRWQRFPDRLDATHLRAYLRKLPDFEDFEAEQRALAHAAGVADPHRALAFFVEWPDLRRASEFVLDRAASLDGNRYEVLSPAAEALEAKYPLAATVLRRAMIDFTLRMGRSSRYGHAARHLAACRDLALRVEFGSVIGHEAYERGLRASHGRKAKAILPPNSNG